MSSVILLQQVHAFAAAAHEGQQRKYGGEPYINHPERVMNICRTVTDRSPVLAAALLHDVIEDTAITAEQLHQFLLTGFTAPEADETLGLVIDLTDVYTKEAYPQWNRRARRGREADRLATVGADAQTIKYADILDNAKDAAAAGTEFANILLHEYESLLTRIDKGDPVLRAKAMSMVEEHLAAVSGDKF